MKRLVWTLFAEVEQFLVERLTELVATATELDEKILDAEDKNEWKVSNTVPLYAVIFDQCSKEIVTEL